MGPWLKLTIFFAALVSLLGGRGGELLLRAERGCVHSCRHNATCVQACHDAAGVE
jgi:hypothetical protein